MLACSKQLDTIECQAVAVSVVSVSAPVAGMMPDGKQVKSVQVDRQQRQVKGQWHGRNADQQLAQAATPQSAVDT